MQSRLILACLALLLGCSAIAQNTSSPEPQQPAASAQVQSDTKSTMGTQAEPVQKDKDEDAAQARKLHVRLGTISVGAGYFSGPFFLNPFRAYSFYPYSLAYPGFFYDPFFSPFYGPYSGGFAYARDKGEIKLSANPKTAQVFLDGAYAGTVDHLKNFWLDSGAYNLSISAPGHEPFQQRIYVLSGKSLKINAQLLPDKNQKP